VSDSFGDDTQWARAHFLFELSSGRRKMAIDLEHVRQIAERVTASQGLELVDVEFRGGGKARMLRLFIDKPGGVTHEDCAFVSREFGTILDVENAIPGTYTLEVSSPGLDRKLVKPADFERFAGSRVRVSMREPLDGSRHFEGRLQGLREGLVVLEIAGGKKMPARTVEIDLSNVEKANLVPEF
jgi:ribosome maturation factor RimP